MSLIDRDALCKKCVQEYGKCNNVDRGKCLVAKAKTGDAVPISELRELRDDLYESDQITMNGLLKINQLLMRWETNASTD